MDNYSEMVLSDTTKQFYSLSFLTKWKKKNFCPINFLRSFSLLLILSPRGSSLRQSNSDVEKSHKKSDQNFHKVSKKRFQSNLTYICRQTMFHFLPRTKLPHKHNKNCIISVYGFKLFMKVSAPYLCMKIKV
jgi:hypothetical protein